MKFQTPEINWPTAAVVAAGAVALTLVLVLAPEDISREVAVPLGTLAIAAAGVMNRLFQTKAEP